MTAAHRGERPVPVAVPPAEPADAAPCLAANLPRAGRLPVLAPLLFALYRMDNNRVRTWIRSVVTRFEGGVGYSTTLRRIFREYHGVDVGMYTYGGWSTVCNLDRGTTIGRYSSIAQSATTFTRNHPMNTKSTSALFYNPALGVVTSDPIERTPLRIGNDVWVGHNSIILPGVTEIGDGAIVGAGAVVNKNVPPYAVVVGNPARVVRYRFSQETIDRLVASRWWERSIDELAPEIEGFRRAIESDVVR